MVPMELLSLEKDVGNDAEDDERDDLLNDLQLHERERSAVADEADSVGWHLTAVFEEGNCPRESNDSDEGPMA